MENHQTFDWIFFAIVVPMPFIAALELLKTRFVSEAHGSPAEGRLSSRR